MRLKEILDAAINKKIDYPKALEALKKLRLPYEEEEDYARMLHKLLGDPKKVFHEPVWQLHCIPNDLYPIIFQECMKQVRQEKYSPEIAQYLFDTYRLSPSLINYFLNEAISAVRMNTLNPEEVAMIGNAYYRAMKHIEQVEEKKAAAKGRKPRKSKGPKIVQPSINAEQAGEVEVVSLDECYQ